MKIIVKGLGQLKDGLKKLEHELRDEQIQKLNLKRGKACRRFIIKALKEGRIPVEPIKDQSHKPFYNQGLLADEMEVRLEGNDVRVGYFEDNTNKPEGCQYTYPQLVQIHASGYRAGNTNVPPRPFVEMGIRRYERTEEDKIIVEEFLKKANREAGKILGT